jgi:hypothetical protein
MYSRVGNSSFIIFTVFFDADFAAGVLNLIFFHRYFPSIRPGSVDILDLTLPTVNDVELETLIDSRVNSLIRQHLSTPSNSYSGGNGVRGRIAVEFFERKRKKAGTWFGGLTSKGEEEVCWEIWTLDVTIATPRTESGMSFAQWNFVCKSTNPAQNAPKCERRWKTCSRKPP